MHYERVKHALYPDTADVEDFSGVEGIEVFSDRIQPHSPGLASRMWYGSASLRSAQWAGENGLNLLASSVVKAETAGNTGSTARTGTFAEIQLSHLRMFREHHPASDQARVSQGLVVIPTDTASAEQRAKYEQYAASRTPRTASPQGPARLLFEVDLVGTSDRIAEKLYAHAAFREIDEVAFALSFSFEHEDYVQILTDIATKLGPALGWQPAG